MRGKAKEAASGIFDNRITPAYAGKRSADQTTQKIMAGSPPPMRGKAVSSLVSSTLSRITPAYAGKSVHSWIYSSQPKDHPRLCGEKTKKILKQRYFFHQPASFSFSLQYT